MNRMDDHGEDAALDAIGSLADPARRRLYDYVASRDEPVSREEAASATGMSRTLAAYHLDRLADAGLLETGYSRGPGRSGPGAGRPAKRYTRSARETSVALPPRDYLLLAELMSSAAASDESGQVRDALVSAAEAQGRRTSTPGRPLDAELRARGYEPSPDNGSEVTLRNCPFHTLARRHTDLVCGMNHALLRGVLAAHGDDPDRARLDPQEGRCCVVLGAASRG